MRTLTSGRDVRHIAKLAGALRLRLFNMPFVAREPQALFLRVATPAQLHGRLYEQGTSLGGMMNRVAGKASKICLGVSVPKFGLMTAGAARDHVLALGAGIAPDLARIASGLDMLGTGAVTTFAAAERHALVFEGCGMGRPGKDFG